MPGLRIPIYTGENRIHDTLKDVVRGGDGTINYQTVIRAMNPAHIIYQCLTDPDWGDGRPRAMIDESSFVRGANQLCSEGMGLCLNWTRQEDVDAFVQIVLDHISGVLYTDRKTGKVVLRLLRDDYNVAVLPLYDDRSGLLSIEDDDSASEDEAVNEVIVEGFDPVTNEKFEVRAQNIAAIRSEGQIISSSVNYSGFPTRKLALRAAQRDLAVHAAGLKKFRVNLDRRASDLYPGDVIRIASPRHGITDMVLRILEIEIDDNGSGKIRVRGMEDIFSLPKTTFAAVPVSTWNPPPAVALPPLDARLIEAGYRDLFLRVGNSGMADAENTSGYIGTLAASPSPNALEYDLLSRAEGETAFTNSSRKPFTGVAVLGVGVSPLETVFPVTAALDFTDDNIGQALLLDDEIVELVDTGEDFLTVRRGCADTIPAPHNADTLIWTIDDDLASDNREYASGETVEARLLTRTSNSVLDESESPLLVVEIAARHARPFPPGNVKVNGVSIYSLVGENAEPVLTWTHRNRVMQQDKLVAHEDASVTIESGVTYEVRVYRVTGELLRTASDIDVDTWTYDAAMQSADGNPATVRMELISQRGDISSWQIYSFIVQLKSGWGVSGWGVSGWGS